MSEMNCPHCGMTIYDEDALLCHHCGNSLNRSSSGAMGTMRSAGMKWVVATIVALIIIGFLLLG